MKDYHINVFYSEDDEGYIADIPDLKFCSAFGSTPEEAVREVELDPLGLHAESALSAVAALPDESFGEVDRHGPGAKRSAPIAVAESVVRLRFRAHDRPSAPAIDLARYAAGLRDPPGIHSRLLADASYSEKE